MLKRFLIICLLTSFLTNVWAKENVNSNSGQHIVNPGGNTMLAGCTPSTAVTSLDINNVRTVILINGDMWWNAVTLVNVALYEIPKGSGKTSLFAGSIWIGGLDNSANLYTAAQTYRQTGQDFWPGPIDTTTTSVTPTTCNKFDKHFKLTREEVEAFTADFAANGSSVTVPDNIKNWPGNGSGAQAHYLAPFYDNDGDGIYNPQSGDFPKYYFEKLPQGTGGYPIFSGIDQCGKDVLLGDQTLWWVFNDVGNIHTETASANPIGLEIRAQAFAFTTNDDINNMTFYRYQIINRNTTVTLNNTYFGAWVDPDLGNANDDYVGCDVKRGLGIVYNSNNNDAGAQGYGANPPAAGLDFFEGPLADIGDGIDNDRDSCTDCTIFHAPNGDVVRIMDYDTAYTVNGGPQQQGYYVSGGDTILGREKIIMSKFVYYNNDFTVQGNPSTSHDYYNYLIGKWLDNADITYGGNGKGTGPGATSIPANFMFPGTTDPYGWGTGTPQPAWSEETAADAPGDRRFLQTAGPFTLTPGAVNYITTGAVWARTSSGGPLASVSLLKRADDYAQGLFDHCFKVTDGPDAPDVQIRELNRQFILSMTNDNPLRNNYKENYFEIDPNFVTNSYYFFEGYRVFQVKDISVTSQELCDPDRAREVAQYDIKNGVGQIINYIIGKVPCSNVAPAGSNWNAYIGVDGADNGISHSLLITKDFFTGDNLINHKTYYYMVIAYAYNPNEVPPVDPYSTPVGKNSPYLAGRNNIKIYAAIPHDISTEMGGTVAGSSVGDSPEITRIEGGGNGVHNPNGLEIKTSDGVHPENQNQLTYPSPVDASRPPYLQYPTYGKGHGPVAVSVYDPYKVNGGDFELWATDTSTTGVWVLKNLNSGKIDSSQKTLASAYEQIFTNYGFYINMFQNLNGLGNNFQPGDSVTGGKITSGYVTSGKASQGSNWLGGVADLDATTVPGSYYNWIASGTTSTAEPNNNYSWGSTTTTANGPYQDDESVWETVVNGTWAPFRFVRANNQATYQTSPGNLTNTFSSAQRRDILEKFISSVDIVFTSDPNLWTKCPVFEMQHNTADALGGAAKNSLRKSPSMDKVGNQLIPTASADSGFSWFPGYAINVETGERLNMGFGEDSYVSTAKGFSSNLGADMIWNPDANDSSESTLNPSVFYYHFGGRHAVFVFGKVDTTIVQATPSPTAKDTMYMPAYDEGATLNALLKRTGSAVYTSRGLRQAWATCTWVGYTKLAAGVSSVPLYNGGGNDVRVSIRVNKPYQYFNTGTPSSSYVSNNGMPHYRFNMNDYVVTKNKTEVAKNALDSINVVPNPYYAYSDYDKKAFDSRIKIVNLPSNCKVSIYTTNGTLIRTLYRDVAKLTEGTSMGADIAGGFLYDNIIEWDLRNEKGVPVSSGIYLIHVEAPGLGERTMKWFGVMRPIDLDTF
jgi:hypothetical protein